MREGSPTTAWSEDTLLGGRIKLRQPVDGYRVAIDAVLLAAAVPARAGERVLDVGCGVGAAALCLATRVEGSFATGLELQRKLVRLAGENIARNELSDRVTVIAGDLLRPSHAFEPRSFDHVMANPPFLERGAGSPPSHAGRAAATLEMEARLADWVRFALTMVRPRGTINFIYRADRIERLVAGLAGAAGEIILFPLWPGIGKAAKRVIVRARSCSAAPTSLSSGLVLHEDDGGYTAAAEAILRHGARLPI
jgi:tRNA1(Val) A37 N6-methylase TrmN6